MRTDAGGRRERPRDGGRHPGRRLLAFSKDALLVSTPTARKAGLRRRGAGAATPVHFRPAMIPLDMAAARGSDRPPFVTVAASMSKGRRCRYSFCCSQLLSGYRSAAILSILDPRTVRSRDERPFDIIFARSVQRISTERDGLPAGCRSVNMRLHRKVRQGPVTGGAASRASNWPALAGERRGAITAAPGAGQPRGRPLR